MAWRLNLRALSEGGALLSYVPSVRLGRPGVEYERLPSADDRALLPGESSPAATELICPRCSDQVHLLRSSCENCGFPFICDTAPIKLPRQAGAQTMPLWRRLLGIAALLMMLAGSVSVAGSSGEYNGQTINVVASLAPASDNMIPISGPRSFELRSELALGLLSRRAPEFYRRIQRSVTSISYMKVPVLYNEEGRRVSMEGIGAVSNPSDGSVQVLLSTAFPSGTDELWDYDIFSYAGVLVHEMRHIELHAEGSAPGGWQEEVLCEEAAYAAMQQAGAPPVVLARYQVYLADPQASRYQRWYDWYKQW